MTELQMRRALELLSAAAKLRRQFDTFVLLKLDNATRDKETISVGEPSQHNKGEYFRVSFPIPEDARRYVFNIWRRDIAHKYNEYVRELNQLNVSHSFKLIRFDTATGAPTNDL